jgi:Zn-dependent oligopeptidase
LLGYPNHAAYVLEEQTARSVGAVNDLLNRLAAPAVANAQQEAKAMQAVIDREKGGLPSRPPTGISTPKRCGASSTPSTPPR